MESLWRSATGADPKPSEYSDIHFWSHPDKTGWMNKQGEYIKTWRRRFFVLKTGKLLWFKSQSESLSQYSVPRGVVTLSECLTVKGAEDVISKAHAFEVSTGEKTMYFVAENEKEKEEWINSIGRAIVFGSRSVTESEVVDYS